MGWNHVVLFFILKRTFGSSFDLFLFFGSAFNNILRVVLKTYETYGFHVLTTKKLELGPMYGKV